MSVKPVRFVFALALMVPIDRWQPRLGPGQGKTKDDALDSLLKELDEPEKAASKSDKPAKADEAQSRLARRRSRRKPPARSRPPTRRESARDQAGKPATPKSSDAGKVSPKDQALDELLGKLGETKDEPAAEDAPEMVGRGGRAASRRRVARRPAPTSWAEKTRTSTSGSRS